MFLIAEAVRNPEVFESPTTFTTYKAFNDFFVARVLRDANGNELPPREQRTTSSFTSRYSRIREGSKYVLRVFDRARGRRGCFGRKSMMIEAGVEVRGRSACDQSDCGSEHMGFDLLYLDGSC